jgi:hypothetical protein
LPYLTGFENPAGIAALKYEMPEHQHGRERQRRADNPACKILDIMIARALNHVGPADVGSPMM